MMGSARWNRQHEAPEVLDELRSRARALVAVGQTAEHRNTNDLSPEDLGALLATFAGDVLEACDRIEESPGTGQDVTAVQLAK